MHIITTVAYIAIALAIVAILLLPAELAAAHIGEWCEYKRAHKDIEYNIQVWTSVAKSYDSITEAVDKGMAIAQLVILHHQLSELEANRKKHLCS